LGAQTVQLLLLRELLDYTVLRTEDSREINGVNTPLSIKDRKPVKRVAFLGSKQKAAESRELEALLRSACSTAKFEAKECWLKDNLCLECPRCALYGATALSDAPNIRHRIEYSTAFSLLTFDLLTEEITFNAVDEKSQIQALDRTQPGLPLKKGRCGTMTHDYKRNGTTTLFAALEVAQGKVVGQCYARHRHQEFLKFLQRLDAEFAGEVKLHVVMDNYGTHKHPRVQRWLKRHARFIPHFVPTSSSWLNLVERWFGELTGRRIRRGVFVSVEDLQKAIEEFLAAWNSDPKPFVWTATVDSIVAKLYRCKQTLERIKPGCTRPRMRKNKGK